MDKLMHVKDQVAYDAIESFMKSEYKSKTSFCEGNGIYLRTFNSYLNYTKYENPELYQSYLNHINNLQDKKREQTNNRKVGRIKSLLNYRTNFTDIEDETFDYFYKLLSSPEIEPNKMQKDIGYIPISHRKYYEYLMTFPTIYKIFNDAFNKIYLLDDEEMIKTAKAVCTRIRLGVIKNNEIRDFNLLDYALMTDIPLPLLIPTIKNMNILSNNDSKRLLSLLEKYNNYSEIENEEEYYKNIINSNLYNSKGQLLADENTKENIIRFLIKNNITLYYYKMALYAYLNGEIDLDREYSKEIPNNIRIKIKRANLIAIKQIAEIRELSIRHNKLVQQKNEAEAKYQEIKQKLNL
jgi:hypothetical protein